MTDLIPNANILDLEFVKLHEHLMQTTLEAQLLVRLRVAAETIIDLEEIISNLEEINSEDDA